MKSNEYNTSRKENSRRDRPPREFGNTQRSEFSFTNENNFRRNEINEIKIKNDSVSENKSPKTKVPKIDINKTIGRTSAATTASSVIAAVSTLTITVISVTIGVNVITNLEASANVLWFGLEENELYYEVELKNTNYDDFVIVLSNDNYYKSNALEEGMNYGSFMDITLGDKYSVKIQEDRILGRVIYEEYYTPKGPSEPDLYIDFPKTADFDRRQFDIHVYCYDPEERINNVKMTIHEPFDGEPEAKTKVFAISKEEETQTFSLPYNDEIEDIDIFSNELSYIFSYELDGEEITYDSGDLSFTNALIGYEVTFSTDWKLSSNTLVLPVHIDYPYYSYQFRNPTLTFTPASSNPVMGKYDADGDIETITLEEHAGWQFIDANTAAALSPVLKYARSGDPVNVQFSMTFHDNKTGEEETKVYYDETITISMEEISKVYGQVDPTGYFLGPDNIISTKPIYIDDHGYYSNFIYAFETYKGERYSYPYDPQIDYTRSYFTLWLGSLFEEEGDEEKMEALIQDLDYPVNIYVIYTTTENGTAEEVELLANENILFNKNYA